MKLFEEKKQIGIVEAARKIGVEIHRLYSWEQHGVVRPLKKTFGLRLFRRYSKDDIDRARYVKFLVDKEGYTLKTAVWKLKKARHAKVEQKKWPLTGIA